MKKTSRYNLILLLASLIFFGLNFAPAMAQVVEIEVLGGGYHLKGPDLLTFSSVQAKFQDQQSDLNIRDLAAANYIEVDDENGGSAFQVTVSATNFTYTDSNSTNYSIANSNFEIKNADSDDQTPNVTALTGSENALQLSSDSIDYATLDTPRTLVNGTGQAPGQWRFYPLFRLHIPSGTHPGTYQSTLTFTIN